MWLKSANLDLYQVEMNNLISHFHIQECKLRWIGIAFASNMKTWSCSFFVIAVSAEHIQQSEGHGEPQWHVPWYHS